MSGRSHQFDAPTVTDHGSQRVCPAGQRTQNNDFKDQFIRYDPSEKIKKYMTVITSHTIPGLNEPTTTEHLCNEVVADFGNHKYFNLFSNNIGMKCDHGSHFVPLV